MSAQLADAVLRRFDSLERERTPWVPVWKELAEYMLPRKNGRSMDGVTAALPGDERIYDSTPLNALELLASALGGLLTSPCQPWFELRARPGLEAGESPQVRAFLADARERMARAFNDDDTGFQAHIHELYLDVALLGTGVMYVESDPQTVVRFASRPLGEVRVAESARGMVDTVFRKYELTVRQAVAEWGEACSSELVARLAEHPDDSVEIVHAVFPRRDRDPGGVGVAHFPWACVYLEAQTRHVLEESGYLEMPFMVPRWAKASGDVYGRGPGLTALSDVRVLNAMSRTALMAAEKMSDPPLMVPDDGFLGPVRSGPGGLSYYRAGSPDRIEPLPVRCDLHAAETMMAQRREAIRRIFLNDQLRTEDGPAMSATEAVIRQGERLRVLGPVLGRLQTELLGPLVQRVFMVMLRAGALPPLPQGLSATDICVRHSSVVGRAQREYEAQGLARVMEYVTPLAGADESVMDNFDTDRVARHAADLFGVPVDLLRSQQDVAAMRHDRRQQSEQERSAAIIDRLAGLAHTLSQTKTDGPNALTELAGLLAAVVPDSGAQEPQEENHAGDG
ncbi:portal protein [Pseudodesulfovibrio senegalensis]|uniref:Head-tail adaptor n=1 Tax=Pseudodesulfovibrio senegalensis TaxID=1721087 RepID=A0A6N6N3K2_9BACT|nr:portal protein [Pseudodesulfovibrio senegalensis]KAB1441653.1 head-tail adaptor [Pseudodesulfovibrio senegalensis]